VGHDALELGSGKIEGGRGAAPSLPGGIVDLASAERIGAGRAAEVYAWGEGRVLKLYHPHQAEAWGDRECRVTAAAFEAGLPAPRVFGLERLDGRLGMVMERLEGPSLLQLLGAQPWRVTAVARWVAEVQARLHAARLAGLEPMRERLRWSIARAPLPAPIRSAAEAALDAWPAGDAVCHGDLHPDNVVLTRRGLMVLDWSEASAGPALADATHTSLLLRWAAPPGGIGLGLRLGRRVLHAAWLRSYLRLTRHRRAELSPFLLPVAAARAAQGFEDEAPALRALIERLAA
jgi:aminoglycoside phosphotransferase (APT) family kinase protein